MLHCVFLLVYIIAYSIKYLCMLLLHICVTNSVKWGRVMSGSVCIMMNDEEKQREFEGAKKKKKCANIWIAQIFIRTQNKVRWISLSFFLCVCVCIGRLVVYDGKLFASSVCKFDRILFILCGLWNMLWLTHVTTCRIQCDWDHLHHHHGMAWNFCYSAFFPYFASERWLSLCVCSQICKKKKKNTKKYS